MTLRLLLLRALNAALSLANQAATRLLDGPGHHGPPRP